MNGRTREGNLRNGRMGKKEWNNGRECRRNRGIEEKRVGVD
jgi:hypothetical protein